MWIDMPPASSDAGPRPGKWPARNRRDWHRIDAGGSFWLVELARENAHVQLIVGSTHGDVCHRDHGLVGRNDKLDAIGNGGPAHMEHLPCLPVGRPGDL